MNFRKYTDIIFKSKILTVLFLALIFFIFTFPFSSLWIRDMYIGPDVVICIIFGFIFGPIGFIGSLIGGIIVTLFSSYVDNNFPLNGTNLIVYSIFNISTVLSSFLIYKLWYSFKITNQSIKLIRLDSVKNIIKYFIIISLTAIICIGFYEYPFEYFYHWNDNFRWSLFTTLMDLFYWLILGSLLLILSSKLNVSFYKPKKSKINISPKFFNICLLLAIIINLILLIFRVNEYNPSNHLNQILSIIFVGLVIIFLFKPIQEIKDISLKKTFSITEKFIAIFLLLESVMAISVSFILYFILSLLDIADIYFWSYFFGAICIVLFILYACSIIFLWNIEKSISNPVESISNVMENYSKTDDKVFDVDALVSEVEKFSNYDSEIGILSNSYQHMIKNLDKYMKNLKMLTKDKERISTELNIAKDIQESMLPKIFPAFPNRKEFDLYASNVPAKEVGGDFYDFFLIDEDHLAIGIGDVSGKGVPAALFMVVTKILIKNQNYIEKNVNEVFSRVNSILYENNNESMFVTVWFGILKISTGDISFVNAGHNFPYIKTNNGEVKALKSSRGLVLGVMEGIKYSINKLKLEKGDKIFLYTDGITEAINTKEEFFGEEKLVNILRKYHDNKEILKMVKKGVDEFTGDEEQFDDITMLIFEYKNKI
ncbi:MAG: SpoIIE family protein phosphatase [Methanobrevibacter sp.]|jgi:sigma-B regulation protein RsbU (phosphoserine phosphatase)|nr:SpoIIE family protein phosphatase [Candidatus Methanovirga meridionalis]